MLLSAFGCLAFAQAFRLIFFEQMGQDIRAIRQGGNEISNGQMK